MQPVRIELPALQIHYAINHWTICPILTLVNIATCDNRWSRATPPLSAVKYYHYHYHHYHHHNGSHDVAISTTTTTMTTATLPRHKDHDHRHHPATSQRRWRWARQGRGDNEDNEDNEDTTVRGRDVRGCSASSDVSSDVSSDISLSPLYIPPHCRQSKTECTRGSDTRVWWSRDVTFLSLFHHSLSFSSFHYFSSFYYFHSNFWYIDMHPTLAGPYPFLLGSPARWAFLSYFMFIYMFRIPC